ncbi:hypothetical protein AN396_07575 [Candidatus Epulonipiscium fishelsonii]|uniref:Uncharacterized protein n=1 Tax=Candidatus Epulonipiscium fishelsonii TaxID=77094 RepID=A0ACC8XB87_9FIRM|nr:hypothetical protein AN396_07575 [Epulopiscium sp. SCG-B11WGA-EpuloA1]
MFWLNNTILETFKKAPSDTGGNKLFQKLEKNNGILTYKTENEAIRKLIKLSKLSNKQLNNLGFKNKEIYAKYFNEKRFAKNYFKLIENILLDEELKINKLKENNNEKI